MNMNTNTNTNNSNSDKQCDEYYVNGDYPVDISSKIHPYLRANDSETPMPSPPINGGLYCGPENNAPWMPIKAPPTTTYFIQHHVRNADPPPPPGATEQYPGENRLGNNYVPMPGVNWYNSSYKRNDGPFNIKVIDDKWNSNEGGSANNLVRANSINNNNKLLNSFDLTQYKSV